MAQAQAGNATDDQHQATLAKVLDAVLAKLAEGINAATPAEVGNAKMLQLAKLGMPTLLTH
ncbi:PIII-type proteinase [Lactococcus lactis]|nr:PIII-type proteinase [Lactococcus lactis]